MEQGLWLQEYRWPWIPQFGVNLHFAIDGLSLLMILLAAFLGLISVLASWTEIQARAGFFHFNLPWTLAGVIGILYGAVLAFALNDLKRLVAYTSVSHLGFVLLGVFAWNDLALQGVVMQMICHGFSTGALFILVGTLQEPIHTRDMDRMGGLWATAPRMGAVALFFAMASLGLPGLGNFIGEFLILVGSYEVNSVLTIFATTGLVAATVYSLWIMQRTFHREKREDWKLADFAARHLIIYGVMMIA